MYHIGEQPRTHTAKTRTHRAVTLGPDYIDTYDVSQHVVIHVEVGSVGRTAHIGNIRGLQVPNVLPIQTFKERVLLEVLYPILAQPALPAADESLNEVFGFFGHVGDVGWKLKSLLGVGDMG